MSATTTFKKSGPPVPPRPQHTLPSAASSLLKVQQQQQKQQQQHQQTSSIASTRVTVATEELQQRKSMETVVGGGVGRTLVYKSPSTTTTTTTRITTTTNLSRAMSAPKPPLKLRKAPEPPDVPKAMTANNKQIKNDNIVIVQSSNGVNLNRHNSMHTIQKPIVLKDTAPRLSLGRADFVERNIPINLDQLKPGQPLPRPRKIVKMPVATLDVEKEDEEGKEEGQKSLNIFRRSKTTLDNLASRASNITTVSTGSSVGASNSFFSGKTGEIKNNLKNAAERLFSEIIVNQQQQQQQQQQKHVADSAKSIITKHERAIQHQALLEQEITQERERRQRQPSTAIAREADAEAAVAAATTRQTCLIRAGQNSDNNVTVVTTTVSVPLTSNKNGNNNCTRININSNANDDKAQAEQQRQEQQQQQREEQKPANDVTSNRTEKKIAFHEMLISELAAMRTKSSSMEHLAAKATSQQITVASLASATESDSQRHSIKPAKKPVNNDVDSEDVDADNVEDDVEVEGDHEDDDDDDDDDLAKRLKADSRRLRCPSDSRSSDSSPYGTERSSHTRIRTSDWIEVSDNGKKVTMSSCHISLEDSGLEDEERLDEMSSSGVGDSWDSVKEVENEKRSRSAQRAMSIPDLPPLPKSLSGINKMLDSDSGLLSENDNNNSNVKDNSNCVTNKSISITDTDQHANDLNDNNNVNKINDSGIDDNSIPKEMKESDKEKKQPSAGSATLDIQLATLKKEMFGLRQLDLSLLSQLWALNDSIQEFRTILQDQDHDQEQDSYSPHSPTPSSYDSVSSDGEDEIISNKIKAETITTTTTATATTTTAAKPKIITTQPKLIKSRSTDDDASTMRSAAGQQQLHHQHLQYAKSPAPMTKPHVVPRMRSAPPPPPVKSPAPLRPT